MSTRCYGLICSEETRRERYWVVRGEEAGPIQAEHLSRLDLSMLERTGIPGLLPLEVESVNADVTLRYRIPMGIPVLHYIRNGNKGIRSILELLLSIVRILEESRLYMLDENKYVLLPACIHIGGREGNVSLMYLPLRAVAGKRSLRQELYQLTLQLLDEGDVNSDRCPVLLDCLKSSLFELSEFRSLIVGVLAEVQPQEKMAERTQSPEEHTSSNASFSCRHQEEEQPVLKSAMAEEAWLTDGDTLRFHPRTWNLSGSGVRLILLLLVLVWVPAAWKPSYWTAGAGAVLTILLGAAYAKRCRENTKELEGRLQEEEGMWAEEEEPSEPKPALPERSFDWMESNRKLYADTPAQTVFLMKPEETMVLPAETQLLLPEAKLEYHYNGHAAVIEIKEDRFLFGRCPEEADWLMEDTGISRKHGLLRRTAAGWFIMDCGSRNGTLLNGVPLEKDREYPIQDGDVIQASHTQFIFRLSRAPCM